MRSALFLIAVVAIASGCDNGGPGETEKAAIRAVVATKRGSAFHKFPAEPKSVRCSLNMGGPAPGIVVSGTCATIVDMAPDGSALVRFKETWDGRDFSVNGSRARPGLSHTCDFAVTKVGHASSVRDYGDIYSVP
jgi:hypothetical protein